MSVETVVEKGGQGSQYPAELYRIDQDTAQYGPLSGAEFTSSIEMGVRYNPERGGSDVTVWAPNGQVVDLCKFNPECPDEPVARFRLLDGAAGQEGLFNGFAPGVQPGSLYGFRVYPKPDQPGRYGMLLMDPYAREMRGGVKAVLSDGRPNPAVYPYTITDQGPDLFSRGEGNSAPFVPRCVVVPNEKYDWGDDKRPNKIPGNEIIYEAGVRALTINHPSVPEEKRGTFAGLACKEVLDYLVDLGVTAVELMPPQKFVTEPHLQKMGKPNVWGYNTLGFFAPHDEYASSQEPGGQVREFKDMVKALHARGIKVILDVVYNHTPEQGWDGLMLSFRGLDRDYYAYNPDGTCADESGCGNTNSLKKKAGRELVRRSLRYWADEMHVDGFRFDLASVLTEGEESIEESHFLKMLQGDPVLSMLTNVVEPWGAKRYDRGRFPPLPEWNDEFWKAVRPFFRGDHVGLPVRAISAALGGLINPELQDEEEGRVSPLIRWSRFKRAASRVVSWLGSHDGFTPYDSVSFSGKNNLANGENNRDGNDNPVQARRIGGDVDGRTNDPHIEGQRYASLSGALAFQFASRGMIMMVYGTENGRSQQGNNNAYCQPELTQMPWEGLSEEQLDLTKFVGELARFRREHPTLTRPHVFSGTQVREGNAPELDHEVFMADGRPFSEDTSAAHWQRVMQLYMSGTSYDPGDPHTPDDYGLSVIVNGTNSEQKVRMPRTYPYAGTWEVGVDSSKRRVYPDGEGPTIDDEDSFVIGPLATVILVRRSYRLPPHQLAMFEALRAQQESAAA